MVVKTFFMTNTLVSVHQEMNETSPGADATSSPNTGWTVAKIAASTFSPLDSGTEQLSTTFVATPVHPDGTIDTVKGDCLRTTNTLNGSFAAGNWTFNCLVIAVSSGGDQDGDIAIRLHRSVNADGSGATQITTARVAGSTVLNLTTTAAQNSSVTFNPGAFTLTNEYLFLEIGWEITGAGGANTRDVILRIGTNSTRLVSTDFTAAVSSGTSLLPVSVTVQQSAVNTLPITITVRESASSNLPFTITVRESASSLLPVSVTVRESSQSILPVTMSVSAADLSTLSILVTIRETASNALPIQLTVRESASTSLPISVTIGSSGSSTLAVSVTVQESASSTLPVSVTVRESAQSILPITVLVRESNLSTLPIQTTVRVSDFSILPVQLTVRQSDVATLSITLTVRESALVTLPISVTVRSSDISTLPVSATIQEANFVVLPITVTVRQSDLATLSTAITVRESGLSTFPFTVTIRGTDISLLPIQVTVREANSSILPITVTIRESNLTALPVTIIVRETNFSTLPITITVRTSDSATLPITVTIQRTDSTTLPIIVTVRESGFSLLPYIVTVGASGLSNLPLTVQVTEPTIAATIGLSRPETSWWRQAFTSPNFRTSRREYKQRVDGEITASVASVNTVNGHVKVGLSSSFSATATIIPTVSLTSNLQSALKIHVLPEFYDSSFDKTIMVDLSVISKYRRRGGFSFSYVYNLSLSKMLRLWVKPSDYDKKISTYTLTARFSYKHRWNQIQLGGKLIYQSEKH